MSNKKIDEALGLDTKKLDDVFADLDISDEITKLNTIEDELKENVDNIDSQIQQYNETGLQSINVSDLNSSLTEIKELILISKQAIQKVYQSIEDSELLDSELVQSLSKLVESSHLAIKEYVDIFKDRVSFYDKIRLEMIKHENKKKELKFKHDLDMEKINATKKDDTPAEMKNLNSYSQEEIIGILSKEN